MVSVVDYGARDEEPDEIIISGRGETTDDRQVFRDGKNHVIA